MSKKTTIILLIVAILAIQLACDVSFNLQGEDKKSAQETGVAQTLSVLQGDKKQIPPTQDEGEEKLPTITLQPDVTPTITNTPLPCNKAKFIEETIPDGTQFDPGDNFTKKWEMRNVGECTWTTDYRLVFTDGEQMGGSSPKYLTNEVAPGEVLEIEVNLTAPPNPGDYTGTWKLKAPDGELFTYFWVKINVKGAAFAVIGVTLDAMHTWIEGVCPQTFNIRAYITTNGPGTVTYYWKKSGGGLVMTHSIDFLSAETKFVELDWPLSHTGDYWVKIYIDEPNHQEFGPLNLHLHCTP
ncbi:MAG TPA: hypothetical protein G4N92_07305 [Anaerolineae bacterium]|nr:hypothetical protein [Anaerolineae bacterium]